MNKQEIEKAIETLQDIHDVAEARMKAGDSRGLIYIPQDKLKDLITTISALQQQLTGGWIPVTERLPENDNPVDVTARRKDGARGYFIYKAHYVAPHTQTTEDYGWENDSFDVEYDEEKDCYWIPECWYEDNAIEDNGNWILNDEFDILAWKPLSEPYKEEQP